VSADANFGTSFEFRILGRHEAEQLLSVELAWHRPSRTCLGKGTRRLSDDGQVGVVLLVDAAELVEVAADVEVCGCRGERVDTQGLLFTEGCQVVSSAPLVTLGAAMWCRITELAQFVLGSQKLLKCPPAMSSGWRLATVSTLPSVCIVRSEVPVVV
jgi:hypothetical protein